MQPSERVVLWITPVVMPFYKLSWGRRKLKDDLESKLYIKISKNMITHIYVLNLVDPFYNCPFYLIVHVSFSHLIPLLNS